MVRGCIFDLDGVVVDTAKYHYLAWQNLASDLGFVFTEKDNERLKGVSRMRSLDILLEVGGVTNLSDAQKQEMADRKNSDYLEYIDKMTPEEILPGVREFISELRAAEIGIALGSASKNARRILEKVEISELFDVIIDGNSVSKAKPDPEVFLMGALALGIEPEVTVVFEDAEAGVEAALNASMRCVGVGCDNLAKASIVIRNFEGFSLRQFLLQVEV